MKLITYDYPVISGIDITSFNYYGGITGYDIDREMSSLTFRLIDQTKSEEVYDQLIRCCKYADPSKHIKIKSSFEDYRVDKRPLITIKLHLGSRGIKDGVQFRFEEE